MTKLMIEVPAQYAQEVLDYGNPELALRGMYKRFKSFYKCKVSEAPPDVAEAMEKAMESFMNKATGLADKTNASIGGVRKAVNQIEKNSRAIESTVKNVAANVDKLANVMKITEGLSFLNAGLGMANLAVNVAGFAMVSQKLSEISEQIQEIDSAIQKQVEEKKIDKVLDGRELIMEYNDLSDAWKSGRDVSLDKEQKLLRKMTTYLTSISEYMQKGLLDLELCMDIIMSLLPAYTVLITEYIKQYFFDRKDLPTNFESYRGVYETFTKPEVRTMFMDYFFLAKGVGYNEAVNNTDLVTLLALNDLTTIDDEVEMLKEAGSEEGYKEVDFELSRLAQCQLDDLMTMVS